MAESPQFSHPDEFRRGDGFGVLADRRVFATMAFLNAVGYDNEVQGMRMTRTRLKVRELVQKNLADFPAKREVWKNYYEALHYPEHIFLNYALSMSADYPFRRIRPANELWQSHYAEKLAAFPGILNEFWKTAHLEEVWQEVKPDYIQELSRYDFGLMSADMAHLWAYLRMTKAKNDSIVVNVPDLLNQHNTAIGSRFGEVFYSVDGPGSNDYSLNAHEYLHPITQPQVKAALERFNKKLLPYFEAGRNKPGAQDYSTPLLFVDECLVHALDARIAVTGSDRDSTRRWAESQISSSTNSGLILTLPFYRLLSGFEKSRMSFPEYLPVLLEQLPECEQVEPDSRKPN